MEQFSCPEFEYLYHSEWIGTEKIDGTNLRIHWDGNTWELRGRTDNAQVPDSLLMRINEVLVPELKGMRKEPIGVSPLLSKVFDRDGDYNDSESNRLDITLFGEGYGNKIQKAGSFYKPNGVDFILFDIKIGHWWMKRETVDEIAGKLGIESVPIVFRGSLAEAIEFVKPGFDSAIGMTKAEGLVLTPAVDLFTRRGDRIITKLKTKDFN